MNSVNVCTCNIVSDEVVFGFHYDLRKTRDRHTHVCGVRLYTQRHGQAFTLGWFGFELSNEHE